MSPMIDGRFVAGGEPNPYAGEQVGIGPGQVDPFTRTRAQNRELGKRAIHVADADGPEREPSGRSALVGNGARAEALNAATQARIRLNQTGPEANEVISRALQAERADLEQAGVDVSDPLTNAYITNQLAQEVDDEVDTRTEEREQQEAFAEWLFEQGGGERNVMEALDRMTPDEREEVLDELGDLFAEAQGQAEDAEYDDGVGGEVDYAADGADPGAGFDGGE